MKSSNRDLLVLLKDEAMDNQAIEQEVEQLNQMLYHVESAEVFSTANEVIDMNKYRIYRSQKYLVSLMYERELESFVFLFNKN